MEKNVVILVLLLLTTYLQSQNCDCLKNIMRLQQKVENDQASYQHQVIEFDQIEEYALFKAEINNKAGTIKNNRDCIGLLSIYLSFFKDEHSFIIYDESFDIKKDHKKLKNSRSKNNGPEGIWHFQDGSFSIKIVPSQSTIYKWSAIMLKSNHAGWKKGNVKIDFFNGKDNQLKCIYWTQGLTPKVYDVTYTASEMSVGRFLKFYRNKEKIWRPGNKTYAMEFKELTPETNYLSLPTFNMTYKPVIDSLLSENRTKITSKNNLIIDIRNNRGGGFDAFEPLLPYVLDANVTEQPYYGSVWVSQNNFEYYDSTKYEYAESRQDSLYESEYVEFLRSHLGEFTPIEKELDTISIVQGFPNKVGLIFNRYSASTAEGLILTSMSSNKVKTYGENSMGAVSYGDWVRFDLPELNIWISITTKKMVFKNNEYFESIGISPEVILDNADESDWIKIITNDLEKNKN